MQHVSEADQKWMAWLGRLIFCIERARKLQKMALLAIDSKAEAAGANSKSEMLSRVKREVSSQTQGLQSSEGTTAWLEQVKSTLSHTLLFSLMEVFFRTHWDIPTEFAMEDQAMYI